MKKAIFIASALLVFSVFNYGIYQKEQTLANGETVLLQLGPVDPRSLMQGDYMRLAYAIENIADFKTQEKRGDMVIAVDRNKIGTFRRFHQGEALTADEKLVHYHNRYGQIQIVPDSFMFQEGHARFYNQAKYGVFKFDDKSSHILVGLADENLQLIKAE